MAKIITRDLLTTGAPLSSANALEISNKGTEAVYIDRDYTPDQESPTVTTLRSNKLNKVSRSPLFPAVYNTSAKGGRQLVAKRELLFKHTGDDGVIYQDPMKVTISCEIGNGLSNYLNTSSEATASYFMMVEIRKVIDVLINYVKDSEGNWTESLTQHQIDAMLWGSAEWDNIPADSNANNGAKIKVAPDGIILSDVAEKADEQSK